MNILFNGCTLFGRKIPRPVIPEENNSIRTNENFKRWAWLVRGGKKKILCQTIRATSYFGNSSVVPGFI